MEQMRLNKYLSDAGVCSRREADRLTEEGLVTVNGKRAALGMKIEPGAEVCIRGKRITRQEEKVLLAFHKPAGIVCTAEKREKNNVIDFLNYPIRIFPVGRLDKDSTGLLLMTNDGELVNKIMRAGNYHEKEYLVKVNRPIDEAFCRKMAAGVPILDTVTRPCKVEKLDERAFRIILTQGVRISGDGAEAGAYYEYFAGKSERRDVSEDSGKRKAGIGASFAVLHFLIGERADKEKWQGGKAWKQEIRQERSRE